MHAAQLETAAICNCVVTAPRFHEEAAFWGVGNVQPFTVPELGSRFRDVGGPVRRSQAILRAAWGNRRASVACDGRVLRQSVVVLFLPHDGRSSTWESGPVCGPVSTCKPLQTG